MTQRVLIIDDDEPVLRALVGVLQSAGYDTTGYASPLKFLKDIASLEPAVLIADVRMPEIDGMTMVQAIKDAGCADWPVILISGHADIPMAFQAMRLGAVDFLEKPFTPQRLLEVVEVCAGRFATTDAIGSPNDVGARQARSRFLALTNREREVAFHLVAGKTSKSAAIALGISPRTVDVFRAKILKKMVIGNITALATLVAHHGLA